MNTGVFRNTAAVALAFGWLAGRAEGHIILTNPNGGQQLEMGATFSISWEITIAHTLLNWNLAYSTVDPDCVGGGRSCLGVGPWTVIATNIAAGSPAVGSVHTYEWTVPDNPSPSMWIRVHMNNAGTDYYDVSNGPFSIVAPCPWDLDTNGDVNTIDFFSVIAFWGQDPGGPPDFDGNGDVDVVDFFELLANWGPCP